MFMYLFMHILRLGLFASIIAIVALILRIVTKQRMPKAFFLCLWAMVFIRAIIPFEINAPTSVFNYIQVEEAVPDSVKEQIEQFENYGPNAFAANSAERENSQAITQSAAASPNSFSPILILGCLWVLGTVGMMIWLCFSYIKLYRLFGKMKEINDPFIERLMKKNSMSSSIKVGTLSDISSPVVFGVFKQKIALPQEYTKLSEQELTYILSHEFQHIKRKDNLTNTLTLWVLCLHWFNPLLWLVYKFYHADVEFACDEQVLNKLAEKEKADYARVILKIAENSQKQYMPAPVVGFSQPGGVKERITYALLYKKLPKWTSVVSFVLLLTVFFVFATAGVQAIPVENIAQSITQNSDLTKLTEQLKKQEDVISKGTPKPTEVASPPSSEPTQINLSTNDTNEFASAQPEFVYTHETDSNGEQISEYEHQAEEVPVEKNTKEITPPEVTTQSSASNDETEVKNTNKQLYVYYTDQNGKYVVSNGVINWDVTTRNLAESIELHTALSDGTAAGNVVWSSNNPSVIDITQEGIVSFYKNADTTSINGTITATTETSSTTVTLNISFSNMNGTLIAPSKNATGSPNMGVSSIAITEHVTISELRFNNSQLLFSDFWYRHTTSSSSVFTSKEFLNSDYTLSNGDVIQISEDGMITLCGYGVVSLETKINSAEITILITIVE